MSTLFIQGFSKSYSKTIVQFEPRSTSVGTGNHQNQVLRKARSLNGGIDFKFLAASASTYSSNMLGFFDMEAFLDIMGMDMLIEALNCNCCAIDMSRL